MTSSKDLVKTDSTDRPQRLAQLLVADFPGVDPKDIDVNLEQGQLDIEGKQVPPTEQAESLPAVLFARAFRVPDTIDSDGVSAELKNGVLNIRLKKSEAAKPRRIKVTVG